MNRYNVINLRTGSRYAFTDDDLATKGVTLEQWLERKANAYGRGERRRPVDDDLGAVIREEPGGALVSVIQATEEVRPLSEVHPDWYAVGTPALDGDEVVIPAEHSVEVEDITAEQYSALIDRVWQERAEIQSDPRWGIDAVGVAKIAPLTNPKSLAIHGWLQSLYEEAWAKELAILAGEQTEVGEWTTPRKKPYPVAEALAEADA